MTNLKNNKPNYRFQGYTDAWKQRKLGEIGHAKSGVGFPENEQGGKKGIPFFKVSDMNTDGNENELIVANNYVTDEQISRRKWRVITEVPAIFFAKVGAAVMLNRKRLIRHPFLLDNNTMTYIFNKSQLDSDFGKILFEKIDLTKLTQVGALPSYNSSDVENINIYIPSLPEQEAIGTFFSTLDQHITLHQRKLDMLKEQKKTYLKLLFPAKGQTKPALRFQGFEDDWEIKRISDIGDIVTGNTPSTSNEDYYSKEGMMWVTPTDIDDLIITDTNKKLSPEGEKVSRIVPANSILVTCIASIGKNTLLLEAGSFNQQINAVVPNQSLYHPYFLLTQSYFWSESMKRIAPAATMQIINKNEFSNITVPLPSLPEQEAIGTFFQTLDQAIALVEDKLASLKEMKKALLRKLFVS